MEDKDIEKQLRHEANRHAFKEYNCTEEEGVVRCNHWQECQCIPFSRGFKAARKQSICELSEKDKEIEMLRQVVQKKDIDLAKKDEVMIAVIGGERLYTKERVEEVWGQVFNNSNYRDKEDFFKYLTKKDGK